MLIEYVDIALDLMETAADKCQFMELASEILELGRRKIITVPTWVSAFLADALKQSRNNPFVSKAQTVLPLLTLHLHNGNQKLESKASRIINRCYSAAIDSVSVGEIIDINNAIDCLYIAVRYCTYVRQYNVRKMAACWYELCARVFSGRINPSTPEIIRLLTVADDIEKFTEISPSPKASLLTLLEHRAASDDIAARAYFQPRKAYIATAV